jgi:hypothetical protein
MLCKSLILCNWLSLEHFSTAGQSSADLVLTVKPRPGEFPSSEEIDRQNMNHMLDRTSLEDANMESNGNYYCLFTGTLGNPQNLISLTIIIIIIQLCFHQG